MHAHACTHMHMHARICTCMHGHVYMYRNLQMATDMEESMFIMFTTCMCMHDCLHACVHACMCMCMHVCMGHPHTPIPTPTPSTCHPPRGTLGISKNLITLELIKIIRFCLKIRNLWRISHPWVGVWFGGWVGGWMGSGQIIKNFKNVHPIKIIQFCLKIYDL